MGISNLDEIPEDFPNDIQGKIFYLNDIAAKIIDLVFITVIPLVQRITSEKQNQDDDVTEYEYCLSN